jgi:hypothetical protein
MLINCVSYYLFFVSSIKTFFVLFRCKHVSNFNEIVCSIFLINILRYGWIWRRNNWASSRRTDLQSWHIINEVYLLILSH